MPRLLHRALDALAMATEDLVRRPPAPFRGSLEDVDGQAAPLSCFGALPPAPEPPARAGEWALEAPRGGTHEGDRLLVAVHPAAGARRGTAILVPPWKLRHPWLLSPYVNLARAAGLDAWVLTLPHHQKRAAPGARSGEGFVGNDLGAMRRAFEQTVLELRLLAGVAQGRGQVAVIGLSLGALAAALAATAEPLDAVALVAPPADLAAVLGETAIGRRYRRLAARAGAPLPEAATLRGLLAPLDPTRRPLTARRAFVAAGAHDAIALPEGALALARAWGISPRVYARGHLTLLFACGALRRELGAFLRG